jgi:hypothetical protein
LHHTVKQQSRLGLSQGYDKSGQINIFGNPALAASQRAGISTLWSCEATLRISHDTCVIPMARTSTQENTMTREEIFKAVLQAMQLAEEAGGPEGAEYVELMNEISREAMRRRDNYLASR